MSYAINHIHRIVLMMFPGLSSNIKAPFSGQRIPCITELLKHPYQTDWEAKTQVLLAPIDNSNLMGG